MSQTPQQINTMINRVGIYLTPIFVICSFNINAEWFWKHWKSKMKWGEMGLHPYLLSVAFIVITPISIISFRVLRDMFGVSHKVVMAIHAFLQTSTLVLAILGVTTMWIHMNDWGEDHLGSMHALTGMFMLIVWGIHVCLSLFIFYLGPKWMRAAFRQIHMSLGFAFSIGMLLVIILGIGYEELELGRLPGTENILLYVYQKMKAGIICLLILVFDLYLALYNPPAPRKVYGKP